MKKFLTLVMVLALTMTMSITAFAAGSPSTDAQVVDVTDANGNKLDVEVKVNSLTDTQVAEAAQIAQDESTVVQEAVKSGAIADSNYETAGVLASVEVQIDGDTRPTAENPISISFNVNTAKAGDVIVAAHQKADGTWEYLPTTVADGTVTVKFTSLSPVVFIKLAEKAAADEGDSSSDAAAGTTSPKTGINVVYYAELIAMLSLAGAAVCAKRARR